MRRQYEKEELRAARLGATLTGTFETTADFQAFFMQLRPQEQQALFKQLLDNFSRSGESVPVRIDNFLNMPPFTQGKAFDTKHPHSGFAAHRAESIKGQGRSLRMPEHVATGSSANYNYASVQKDSQWWHQHRECFRQDVELIDLKQAFETFLSIASVREPLLAQIFNGKVTPVIPTFYWKEEEHADPVKQAVASLLYQRGGILSHDDIMMRLGFDPEKQKQRVKSSMDEMRAYTIYDTGISLMQTAQQALAQKDDDDE